MSLKTKINNRLQDSSNWILNTPESLVILLLMGTGIGGLAFGSFSIAMGFSKHWFFMILFGVFSFFSSKKFIDIFKMVKRTSLKDALGGFTANEFVWKKDKEGNKLYGGVEDGHERNSEGADTRSSRSDKEDEGGQRQDNRQSKSTNIRFGEYIQSNVSDSKETTND